MIDPQGSERSLPESDSGELREQLLVGWEGQQPIPKQHVQGSSEARVVLGTEGEFFDPDPARFEALLEPDGLPDVQPDPGAPILRPGLHNRLFDVPEPNLVRPGSLEDDHAVENDPARRRAIFYGLRMAD